MLRKKYSVAQALVLPLILPMALFATLAVAQTSPVAAPHANVAKTTPVASDKDVAATQEELIRLLQQSPTLTTVVARDPSLLANLDYVRRNNPQLAQYLENHPEVVLNPDFYLFTHLHVEGEQRYQALEREVWPDLSDAQRGPSVAQNMLSNLTPFLVFLCVMGALLWLTRVFVENRRWSRIFKLQTEVHSKLIDRFSGSEELLSYIGTEAGKRFLEAAPIPIDFEPQQRMPNAVARVLTPLQIGIVLTLLGAGFLALRHIQADMRVPMMVIGTIFLMPGIGFILSAGVTWLLAGRLGLIPDGTSAGSRLTPPQESRFDSRIDTSDRQ